jgi:hypothetical protein
MPLVIFFKGRQKVCRIFIRRKKICTKRGKKDKKGKKGYNYKQLGTTESTKNKTTVRLQVPQVPTKRQTGCVQVCALLCRTVGRPL